MRSFESLDAEVCVDIQSHFHLGTAVAVLVSTYNYRKNASLRTERRMTVTRQRVLGFYVAFFVCFFLHRHRQERVLLWRSLFRVAFFLPVNDNGALKDPQYQ